MVTDRTFKIGTGDPMEEIHPGSYLHFMTTMKAI